MNEHTLAETPREYGELYYHPSAITSILHALANTLEGDKRRDMLNLSHGIPTTMPWPSHSTDLQLQADGVSIYRPVQLRLQYPTLLGPDAIRLACVLQRGPGPKYPDNWEHLTGMADRQLDASK